MSRKLIRGALSCTVASTALVAALGALTPASAQVEEIIVTGQKREQSIQSIPISVTAFDASALDAKQIDSFSDLQFNTPNVSFSKTNFTGSNFQIRGIGSNAVAASGDGGVGIHVNDAPLRSASLFETEFFDIERLEIMRGPQGTLFGRNATGGVVNLITKKPGAEFEGNISAQYGNFNHQRVSGMMNIPITDTLAVRFAGLDLKRDGYTENLYTGNMIDGRDQYALRGSLRWEISDAATFDFMYSYFEEDSNRSRITKQMCHTDPTGILGCLPDKLAFETTNAWATLGGILTSDVVLGPLAWGSIFGPDGTSGSPNPADLREVYTDFEPMHAADENLWTAQFEYEFDQHTLTIVGSQRKASVWSRTDYNWAVNDPVGIDLEALLIGAGFPTQAALYADGLIPISAITDTDTGIIGGNIDSFNRVPDGWDQSNGDSEQWTAEVRIASDLEGDFNYLVGGFMMHTESEGAYYVVASSLDYFALVGAGLDNSGLLAPFFKSDTKTNELDSWAIFGEAYFQLNDDIKFTGGLRFNNDEKTIEDRQLLLTNGVVLPPGAPFFGTGIGDDALVAPQLVAPDFRTGADGEASWEEMTGRLLVEWTPDLSWTDDTLIYASYSRGYKGGGFNPPSFSVGTQKTFDPEFIDAIEVGIKNTMLDGTLHANFNAFFYDYQGLQVSKIVDRTSLNENIDAEISGLEAELLWAPNESWLANMTISLLNTEIAEGETSIDPRDPTNGLANYLLIKDLSNASNCVVDPGSRSIGDVITDLGAMLPFPIKDIPGLPSDGTNMVCDDRTAEEIELGTLVSASDGGLLDTVGELINFYNQGLPGTPVGWVSDAALTGGNAKDLGGNALQNAPEWSISLGAQRTHYFNNGYELAARVDYYKQGDFYARIHNRPIDKVQSWQMINLSATLSSPDKNWELKAFVQNLLDDDNVTGHYFTDASSGNFTNVFVLDPRLMGLTLTAKF